MKLILKYFPDLSSQQITQFSDLQDLYREWNARINVISRKDIDNLYIKHILHSLSIAKFIQFEDNSKILDVGTGGGFPGIPLSIMFPNVKFLLIDSILKKINVVNAISRSIGLRNVETQCVRAEDLKGKFDFAISRAVTNMNQFKLWVKSNISNKHLNQLDNGILCLKGGDLTEELKEIENIHQVHISNFFDEEFFITKKIVYIGFNSH